MENKLHQPLGGEEEEDEKRGEGKQEDNKKRLVCCVILCTLSCFTVGSLQYDKHTRVHV